MELGLWSQAATDSRRLIIDYTNFLPSLVVITSCTASVDISTVPPLKVIPLISSNSLQVIPVLSGGVASTTYKVTFTTTMSDLQIKTDTLLVSIEAD